MSADDRVRDTVKTALTQEGWSITHDPLYLDFDSARLQVDLAGEKLIAAERGLEKIAVEVKSFLAPSTVYEFHLAVGQCFTYRVALRSQEPDRQLYLAIPWFTYKEFFCRPFAEITIQEAQLNLLVFDPNREVIVQWKN